MWARRVPAILEEREQYRIAAQSRQRNAALGGIGDKVGSGGSYGYRIMRCGGRDCGGHYAAPTTGEAMDLPIGAFRETRDTHTMWARTSIAPETTGREQ